MTITDTKALVGLDAETIKFMVDHAMAVLTDGTPSRNFVTDLQLIQRRVREWNPGARVQLHTIGLGTSDEAFLQGLADDNRGTFVSKRR